MAARGSQAGPDPKPKRKAPTSASSAPKRSSAALGRRTKGAADSTTTGTTPAIADPIGSVRGKSTWLRPVMQWSWPGSGRPYLSKNVQSACVGASERARLRKIQNPTPDDQKIMIEASDLIAAALSAARVDPQAWSRDIDDALSSLGTSTQTLMPSEALARWKSVSAPDKARLIDVALRWDAVALLAEASALRKRTNTRHESIGLRHVCFAALTSPEGQQGLQDLGLLARGLGSLSAALIAQIDLDSVKSYWDEPDQWQALFSEVRRQALLIAPPPRRRSGYTADLAGQAEAGDRPLPDPLGIETDASALADLILLEEARPPLAIALFGSWGSGKTTLINRLKREIVRQTAEERERDEADEDPQTRRVRNVAQLDFNAWSFADSQNLWASLTAEIFEQLKAGGGAAMPRARGEQLVSEVAEKLAQNDGQPVGLASSKTIQTEIDDLQTELREKRAAREMAPITAAEDLAGADSAKLDTRIQNALSSEAGVRAFEARSTRASRAWWLFGQTVPAWLRWTAAAALLLLIAGISVLLLVPNARETWAFLTALPLVSTLVAVGTPIWRAVKAAARYEEKLFVRRAELGREAARLQGELDAKNAEFDRVREEEAKRAGKVRSLAETKGQPGRLLQYLLSDSADIQAIKGQVGLMATVRRCFETLDELIARQRRPEDGKTAPRRKPKHSETPPLDRIILYIDDLDRCAADEVVKVLEAVHLLLAFECFVVIVAIDARWLRLSLERNHPQFKDDPHADDGEDKPSPSDYLEKIFQIPFWVRPMSAGGAAAAPGHSAYAAFLDELLGPREAAAGSEQKSAQEETGGEGASAAFVWIEPSRPEREERPHAERVRLTDAERDLLAALEPIAAKSPRAVKRLVNIYRLIRAAVPRDQETAFLSAGSEQTPSFAAVQFSLAVDASLPAASVPRLWELVAQIPEPQWALAKGQPGMLRKIAKQLPGAALDPGHGPWDELRQLLTRSERLEGFIGGLEALVAVRHSFDRADLARAASLTQRYSFRAP